jgi:hypothetical protein
VTCGSFKISEPRSVILPLAAVCVEAASEAVAPTATETTSGKRIALFHIGSLFPRRSQPGDRTAVRTRRPVPALDLGDFGGGRRFHAAS